MAFCSLATLKEMLGIPAADTSRDAFLTLLCGAADRQVLAILGLTSTASTTYVDKIDIDDEQTEAIFTRSWPVIAMTSVVEAGSTLAASEYSVTDYGLVKRLTDGWYWAHGRESIVLTYTAGWTGSPPDDLVYAATLIAAHSFNTGPRSGLRAERIGQYSYELGGASVAGGTDGGGGFGIPPEAERILASWRRVFTLPN